MVIATVSCKIVVTNVIIATVMEQLTKRVTLTQIKPSWERIKRVSLSVGTSDFRKIIPRTPFVIIIFAKRLEFGVVLLFPTVHDHGIHCVTGILHGSQTLKFNTSSFVHFNYVNIQTSHTNPFFRPKLQISPCQINNGWNFAPIAQVARFVAMASMAENLQLFGKIG